jgi:hypothetical protein
MCITDVDMITGSDVVQNGFPSGNYFGRRHASTLKEVMVPADVDSTRFYVRYDKSNIEAHDGITHCGVLQCYVSLVHFCVLNASICIQRLAMKSLSRHRLLLIIVLSSLLLQVVMLLMVIFLVRHLGAIDQYMMVGCLMIDCFWF